MKTKKLKLNKQSISNLNNVESIIIYGGVTGGCSFTGCTNPLTDHFMREYSYPTTTTETTITTTTTHIGNTKFNTTRIITSDRFDYNYNTYGGR